VVAQAATSRGALDSIHDPTSGHSAFHGPGKFHGANGITNTAAEGRTDLTRKQVARLLSVIRRSFPLRDRAEPASIVGAHAGGLLNLG
jgi:hypothetical protein